MSTGSNVIWVWNELVNLCKINIFCHQPTQIWFTQIVLKFEIALLFWTIHINLMKFSRHILGLIGHKICWSDKKQPVIVDLKPPKICTTFKQQATSVFTILNCRSGRTSCMWKFSVVATRLEQRLGCAYFFFYSIISLNGNHLTLFLNQTTTLPDWNFCRIFANVVLKIFLVLMNNEFLESNDTCYKWNLFDYLWHLYFIGTMADFNYFLEP